MKSTTPGQSTSPAKVIESPSPEGEGFHPSQRETLTSRPTGSGCSFVGERELFVPFKEFPWFREASVREIANVQLPNPHHLYLPDLDIDLAVESIEHAEKYPLVSKAHPIRRPQPTVARARAKKQASRRSS